MFDFLENTLGFKSLVWRQFIVYSFVALIPASIDFSILYFLTEFLELYYVYAFVFAFSVGSLISYVCQKTLTFKNESEKYTLQFTLFALLGIFALLVNLAIVFLLVEFFSIYYLWAKAIAILIVVVLNFLLHKYISFSYFK